MTWWGMWAPWDHGGAKGNGAKSGWDTWKFSLYVHSFGGKDLAIAPWLGLAGLAEQLPLPWCPPGSEQGQCGGIQAKEGGHTMTQPIRNMNYSRLLGNLDLKDSEN